MSRNRLKNSQSLHWMGVVKWILIVGLMSVLGLSYMLCKNRNLHVAQEVLSLKNQLDAIQDRNSDLALDLEKMKSLRVLQRRLVEMHSTLVTWGDTRATWERMDQSTRARLARINTEPNHVLNFNAPVAATDATPTQH